jgi:hypothetical protein
MARSRAFPDFVRWCAAGRATVVLAAQLLPPPGRDAVPVSREACLFGGYPCPANGGLIYLLPDSGWTGQGGPIGNERRTQV